MRIGIIRISRIAEMEHSGAIADLLRGIGFEEIARDMDYESMHVNLKGTSEVFDEVDSGRASEVPYYKLTGFGTVQRVRWGCSLSD